MLRTSSERRVGWRFSVFIHVLKTSLRDSSTRRIWRRVANNIQSVYRRPEDPSMVLLRTTWIPVLERASSLGFNTFRKLVLGSLKYDFRTTDRLTFLGLHERLEGQSSRLVFKTAMKTCCKQYLTVLKRASSLCCKKSRKLVLGALKWRLQKDGSVKVFKSPYTSWRPVFEAVLPYGYEDVLQTIFNLLEMGVKVGLQDV